MGKLRVLLNWLLFCQVLRLDSVLCELLLDCLEALNPALTRLRQIVQYFFILFG